MANPSTLFSELTAVSLPARRKNVTDNVSENNALLRLFKKGNIRMDQGGTQIEEPIFYDTLAVQNFSNFQRNDIAHKPVLTAVKFDWVQKWLAVVASGRELNINSGETAMVKLVKNKLKNAEISAANHMAVEVYGDASTSSSINGLAALIGSDGTGTVGGIDASVTTIWKNQWYHQDIGSFGTSTIRDDLAALYMEQVRGIIKPDAVVLNHDAYKALETSMVTQTHYMQPDMASKTAMAGFENVGFKGIPAVFDANVNFANVSAGGAPKAYLLNMDTIYMFQHPNAKWDKDETRVPVDQDAIVIPFKWMGNLAITARRNHGIYYAS